MHRRTFLIAFPSALSVVTSAQAHSPWGHYVVYRQKHLLVLSTRDDADSYGYSRQLVEAINTAAPEASARPARAKDLDRAYDLLRTDQFQFALLSHSNIATMRAGTERFAGRPTVDLKTIYRFGELEFVVRADFPQDLVSIVTDAVVATLDNLPGALPPSEVRQLSTLHPGARDALENY